MLLSSPPCISFEFFPPKSDAAEAKLWEAVGKLARYRPSFVSVTYGAGGTTRDHTHRLVRRIRQETDMPPAAHLTCIGARREEIDAIARTYHASGVRHIVALRGDPPEGEAVYRPHPEGYAYASDLIEGLLRFADFEISVAAFPEKHPESPSLEADLEVLRRKERAGATRAITQFFFEADPYLRLRDRMARARIHLPLVPGLIPIGNFAQLKRFAGLCGARIPAWLETRFAPLDADAHARDEAAIETTLSLAERLKQEGVGHFHFYTLNRADLTAAICDAMGICAEIA
jgi:methylenetetrahydrofolate reductase (NADPH)